MRYAARARRAPHKQSGYAPNVVHLGALELACHAGGRGFDDLLQGCADAEEANSPSRAWTQPRATRRKCLFAGDFSRRRPRAGRRSRSALTTIRGCLGRECSHSAVTVARGGYGTRRFAGISERMMGLEPTTFCMAS